MVVMREKRIKIFLPDPGTHTLQAGPAPHRAKFRAQPPDGDRLSRAGLAVRLCGRQMVLEAAVGGQCGGHNRTGRPEGPSAARIA